jgi:hypothetical protein
MVNGPPDTPVFDSEAEAAAAVDQLMGADIVLTTYPVLQQEVHFSGSKSNGSTGSTMLGALRHNKRYKVPESPLLQLHWWRLVLDEAQMVGGGLSNVAVMAERLNAWHRWVVTGTPIGGHGLDDLQGLLRLIKAEPFRDGDAFHTAIKWPCLEAEAAVAEAVRRQQQLEEALLLQQQQEEEQQEEQEQEVQPAATGPAAAAAAGGGGGGGGQFSGQQQQQQPNHTASHLSALEAAAAEAWTAAEVCAGDAGRRLVSLVKPLMWRVTKATSARDHPLPPRRLAVARLRLGAAERSFYDTIVEKTAAAREQLLAEAEEVQEGVQQQQQQQQQQQEEEEVVVVEDAAGAASSATGVAAAAAAAGGDEAAGADNQQQQQQPAAAAGGHASRPHSRGGGSHRRSHRPHTRHTPGDAKAALDELAARELHQLRLACVHPQLTAYWKELSAELQLRQGGALGIGEILGRMRASSQLKLQQQERELCCHLNALALQLLAAAAEAEAKAAAAAGGDGSGGEGRAGSNKGGAGGSSSSSGSGKKKRRRSSQGQVAFPTAAGPAAAAAGGDDTAAAAGAAAGPAAAGGGGGGGRDDAPAGSSKRVRFAPELDNPPASPDGPPPPPPPAAAAAAAGAAAGAAAAAGGSEEEEGGGRSPQQLRSKALQLLEESFKVGVGGCGVWVWVWGVGVGGVSQGVWEGFAVGVVSTGGIVPDYAPERTALPMCVRSDG